MAPSILPQVRKIFIQQNLFSPDWQEYADVPFVIPSVFFPWDIFKPIENAYYICLHRHLKLQSKAGTPDDNQLDLFPQEEQTSCLIPVRSSRAGRKPHDFMALFRAFELASLLYVEIMVESVYLQVISNPLFATYCGFTVNIPSYRSFARFDEVMTTYGLWEKARQLIVDYNKQQGIVEAEDTLAVDTTHIEAEATLGKTIKTCSHENDCECPKVPTDDNVGLMRKSNSVSYVAHKLSMISGVKGQLPLTREVCKGGMHDGLTLEPTLKRFKAEHPKQAGQVRFVLADGIYQSESNQKITQDMLGAKLVAPINPRNHKDKPVEANGIEKINRYGIPVCLSGHNMELKGSDRQNEQFIFMCPVFNPQAKQEGLVCPHANHIRCCNGATQGRIFRVDFAQTPQVDSEFSQHSRTFDRIYDARTGIERLFGMLKDGYSMRRVHKRGKKAVEAHVDRCMLTLHLMAFIAHFMSGCVNRGWTRKRLKQAN